jgi:Ser/Thr protein kinase RdoA (MazF antagonist)
MNPPLGCSYSTISCQELIEKVLPEYLTSQPLTCLFWERGANDTYKVSSSEGSYFLRIYRHNAFSREANEFEAEALHYLHQQAFPVAYPIARKSGGFITAIDAPEGVRTILLTALAAGESCDYSSLDNCQLVGVSVANMHSAFDGFKTSFKRADLRLPWLLEDSMVTLRKHLKQHSDALSLIEKIAQNLRTAVQSVPEETLDRGVCHGDLHGGNLHIHEGIVTHFDFEECAFGYRVYDLATFKWGACRGDSGIERWAAFIKGYLSVRSLSDADLSLVNTFAVIREIAETAYGIRHVGDFGQNDIMASDVDYMCKRFKKLHSALS